MKKVYRVISSLLTVLVLTGAASPSYAVMQEEIDTLIEQANGIQEERDALEQEIGAYSMDIAAALDQKTLLDAEIAQIESDVAALETQILDCEGRIATTEAELRDAQSREAEQYDLFCQRVRAMEEQGRMNYWMILFHATSFVDFLTRLDFVNEIMQSDRRIMDDLKSLQAEIADKQIQLEGERLELETANQALLEKKAELDAQREAANQLIIDLEANRSEAEASRDILNEEAERVQSEIVRLSEELARQEEEARIRAEQEAEEERIRAQQAAEAYRALRERVNARLDDFTIEEGLGGYIWPVNSRRITSTFGGRASPGGIGSTNHKGIDIGGVGYGTAVHAAKAGTVIISQYSSSYGNFVVVSHGNGNTTLYAHMSTRLVEAGEAVEQGDILGLTGSTGHSTGPHLHFEISENGTRINPLVYLSGYSLA
ncbi:MAG: peptidoglycan DD-metalloendopeptidase family protein [Oscillibacter sp.]|nr:peptidoglycan DD-metalloendopeptidase family protein [Oscillibacter sp.]MBQ9616803.1 peptidoglycan DD-metalloendopeptidase family protein [Oscillibacter sp.]